MKKVDFKSAVSILLSLSSPFTSEILVESGKDGKFDIKTLGPEEVI